MKTATSIPALLAMVLLGWSTNQELTAQSTITNASDIHLVSAIDESGGFPSFESQRLRLTFARPNASGFEVLPVHDCCGIRLNALFADGSRLADLDIPIATFGWQMSAIERAAALALTPRSPNQSSAVFLWLGGETIPEGNTQVRLELYDQRAPATLDYVGTFGSDDPHDAAMIGQPYEQRTKTALADFRRLAGVSANFAPWETVGATVPTFLLAQADGLIVGDSIRYHRDGSVDSTYSPPSLGCAENWACPKVLGQLPDGRYLGRVITEGLPMPRRREPRLVALTGTNILEGEVLALMEPSYSLPGPQFAIVNADGSMIFDQGVRRRGCTRGDDTATIGLPSLNGERLRSTKARLFWRPPVPTRFAFRQLHRSRAVRESAGSITVEVRRLGDLGLEQAVSIRTEAGTAKPRLDYQNTNTWLSFEPGRVSQAFRVPIVNDNLNEGPETFTLRMAPEFNTTAQMIATPRHTVTIREEMRLEWATPNRVRVWNPAYQFIVRAYNTVELAGLREFGETIIQSATQLAPAADYFDLDLTTVPALGEGPLGTSYFSQPYTALRDQYLRDHGGGGLFLRAEGVDDDTEETNDYCP